MTKLDSYLDRVEQFHHLLVTSEIYLDYVAADKAVYEDEKVVELAAIKAKLEDELDTAYKIKASDSKVDEILAKIKEVRNAMGEIPSVIRYYECQSRLKEFIKPLENEILIPIKKVKHD